MFIMENKNQASWNKVAIISSCLAAIAIVCPLISLYFNYLSRASLGVAIIAVYQELFVVFWSVILSIFSFVLGVIATVQIRHTKERGSMLALLALLPLLFSLFGLPLLHFL